MLQNSAQTIVVSSSEDLAEAYETLSHNGGGTIRVAEGAEPIEIALSDGGVGQVRIESADPDNPTLLHRIAFTDVENVTVSGFNVDSTGVDRPGWHQDVMVTNSDNIVIQDSDFKSNAVGRYGPDEEGTVLGESFGIVRGSTDFVFEGNTVEDYYQGLSLKETVGVSIADNEFAGLQGDGLRLSGVQNADVVGNYLHDFLGTTNNFNHNDFIQVWSSNTTLTAKNLTFSSNVLDSGDGSSAQGIFIGNERFNHGETDHIFQNIEIFDNVIHSGNANGISVRGANNVEVSDNTLLWNRGAETVGDTGDSGVSRAPLIRLEEVTRGSVDDNITPGLNLDDNVRENGNRVINYTSPNDPNFVGTHFINATEGGALDPNDLRLRPDSEWNGEAGAELSAALTATESGVQVAFTSDAATNDFFAYTFDASASVDENGFVENGDYDFVWTLEDGTVLNGIEASHNFTDAGSYNVHLDIFRDGVRVESEDRVVNVASKDLVELDLNRSVVDTSAYASSVEIEGARAVSSGGYRIGGDDRISIGQGNLQIHDLESFGITADLRVLNGDDGRFLLLHRVLDARVLEDGSVQFTLHTDEGSFVVDSGEVSITDGAFHNVGFAYNGETLSVHIDGDTVGEVPASGVTAPAGSQELVIGSKWSPGVNAIVDNFHLGADPQVVGLAEYDAPTPAPRPAPAPAPEIVPEAPTAPDEQITPDHYFAPEELSNPLVEIGFDDGDGATLRNFDEDNLTDTRDAGYRIEGGQNIQIERGTEGLHNLSAFSLELDVTADTDDLQGTLVYFHRVLEVKVDSKGVLQFELDTDQGTFLIETSAEVLSDGQEHTIGISYDDEIGQMSLQIDGVTVAQGEASGVTAEHTYFGLTIGHNWNRTHHDTYEATVDDIVLSTRTQEETEARTTEPDVIDPVETREDDDPFYELSF